MRIETGALQINDDWTGLFIRGDDALELLGILGDVYCGEKLDKLHMHILFKYISIIDFDVDHNNEDRKVQRIKRVEESE